jgi:hypothetical protein
MTASDRSGDFRYVQTDIPEGMTIGEWRARRAANRPTRHRWRLRARASAVAVSRAAARAVPDQVSRGFARVATRHQASRRTAPPRGEVTV